MDALERKQVVKLARKARAVAERLAKEEGLPRRLHGMCARASGILFELLEEVGFKPRICFGNNHCFLEVDDMIVDVTASQFGYSKIFIVPISDLFSRLKLKHQEAALEHNGHWDYDSDHSFDSVEEAIVHQRNYDWPSIQSISREDFI